MTIPVSVKIFHLLGQPLTSGDSVFLWWPGQLVVRVCERGIASIQEVSLRYSQIN
jgi:hypothetical protein